MSSKKSEKSIDVYTIPTEKPVGKAANNSCWHINRESWRFKVHFFLYLSALGTVAPYLIVFAKDRVGISASSLGVVLTAQMFLFIFTKPIIGYLADYFNKLKAMIAVLTVVTAVCNFLLLTIPNYERQQLTGFGNQTQHSKLSMDTEVCEKYIDLLHAFDESNAFNASSASQFANITFQNQVFVVCFQEGSEVLSCLKQCSNNREMVKVPLYHESKSLCEVAVFRNREFFNETDCSVECVWDKSPLCHPEDDSSSPIKCMEQICLYRDTNPSRFESRVSGQTRPTGNALTDCIYFGDLLTLCDSEAKPTSKQSETVRATNATTYEFWVFTILFTISSVNVNGIFTLSDTACFETIQRTGSDFGRQRLWGAIGWGLSASVSGYINDCTGDYLASWIVMGVLYVLFLWNMTKLDLVKPHFSKNILKDVGSVFKSREFIAFEVSVLMNGMGTAMIWNYLIWFLTSIGGSKLLCGLSLTVQSGVGVIPFMFFSGWVIRRIGHFNCLTLALAAYFVRFLWYSYLHNPWYVLPVEFLHGVSYGLYYAVLASYGKMSAKPGTEATTQAVIFSTHEGLGSGLGCVLAGLCFDSIGGHQTFYYASLFSACGVAISLVCSLLVDNRTGEMNVTTSTEEIHPTQKGVHCSKFKKSQLDL